MHDDRLIEIETRIAYQEDALRTLSEGIVASAQRPRAA